MENLGERISIILIYSNLTKKDFANRLGISEQAIGNYAAGRRKPSFDVLLKMKQMFNISTDWLLTGEGEMLKTEGETEEKSTDNAQLLAKIENLENINAALRQLNESQALNINLLKDELESLRRQKAN